MILVLAGTKDGREIVKQLLAANYSVIVSVVSDYGKALLATNQLTINNQPLPDEKLREFIIVNQITTIIDATHPYATHISQTAIQVAQDLAICYIRYERQAATLPKGVTVFKAADYAAAAKQAAALGQTIFLTTGSRNLATFAKEPCVKSHTLIARVLPDATVLLECAKLGFLPNQLIAMQGPFSHDLNKALYQQYSANVIVMKNSGKIGGTDTKLSAALELSLPVVMIDRPRLLYPCMVESYEDIVALLNDKEQ